MSPTERLRQLFPFAAALYLAATVAYLQAKQPAIPLPRDSISLERVMAGFRWHMAEMAKIEQAATLIGCLGN